MKKLMAALVLSSIFAHTALADNKPKTETNPKMDWTAVQRENMAKMHENMATCLRSSKSPSECRVSMRTSCKEMGNDCPMMGGHGHGKMMDGCW